MTAAAITAPTDAQLRTVNRAAPRHRETPTSTGSTARTTMCRYEHGLPMPDDGHDLYDRVRDAESDHGEPYDPERYEAWFGPSEPSDALLTFLGGRRDA